MRIIRSAVRAVVLVSAVSLALGAGSAKDSKVASPLRTLLLI